MKTPFSVVAHARANRKHPTEEEDLLWQAVRRRGLGFRLRRQHPCGNRIFDFYCPAAALAIEIDGDLHDEIADRTRDDELAASGITVLRFANADVRADVFQVLEAIQREIVKLRGPSSPSPRLRGEGAGGVASG